MTERSCLRPVNSGAADAALAAGRIPATSNPNGMGRPHEWGRAPAFERGSLTRLNPGPAEHAGRLRRRRARPVVLHVNPRHERGVDRDREQARRDTGILPVRTMPARAGTPVSRRGVLRHGFVARA